MSSDSGESHSSAHNDHGDEMDVGEGAMGASDMEDNDDAQSLDNASELSVRPRLTVEESPASTDIPDDTPSVQVGCLLERHGSPLTKTGFRHILTNQQRSSIT
jgi:hypothetical protein